jgi:hypothetical protein
MKNITIIPIIMLFLFAGCGVSLNSCKSANSGREVSTDSTYTMSDTTTTTTYVDDEKASESKKLVGEKAVHKGIGYGEGHGSGGGLFHLSKKIKIGKIEEIKAVPVCKKIKDINNPDDLGVLVYKIPDTMKVGSQYQVRLRISKFMTREIQIGLTTDDDTSTSGVIKANIRIGTTMKAELKEVDSGSKSFEITQLSSGEQIVDKDSSFTTWEWNIKPVKSGSHRLKMFVVIKEGELSKDVPVYEDNIYIRAYLPYTLKIFWSDNWQYILSTLIIPFIVFLWNNRRKKRKKKE